MDLSDERIIELLRECPLFQGMSPGQISHVLTGNMGRISTHGKGALIAQSGEEVRFLHILLMGNVKGEMIDYTGKVIKIEDIAPVRPLAPAFLFGRQNRYPVHITSGDNAVILSIPRDRFLVMLQQSAPLLENFMHIISSRGQFLSNKIKFLSFTTIKGKLAQYLLDLSAKQGTSRFVLPLSQVQLSELFGVTRPSIGRAMGELKREGLLRTEGRHVEILDYPGLTSHLK